MVLNARSHSNPNNFVRVPGMGPCLPEEDLNLGLYLQGGAVMDVHDF